MPMDDARLRNDIYQETKNQLIAIFGAFRPALLSSEQNDFDFWMDRLALAIGNGDGGITVAEITTHADIVPQPGDLIIPGDGLLDSKGGAVGGEATNDTSTLPGRIE